MTFVAGTVLSAAALNAATSSGRCHGHLSANPSAAVANTPTRMVGFTEDYDTVAMFDGANGLITAPSTGVMMLTCGLVVNSFGTAFRRSLVIERGSGSAGAGVELVRDELESTDRVALLVAKDIPVTAGDVISAYVNFETAGTIQGASYVCWISARMVG